MKYFRSSAGNLHRDTGGPAVVLPGMRQWWMDNRLHRPDGPAVETDSGTRMHYWRGIHISPKIWKECESYTFSMVLGIENIELRRAVLEKVGFVKFEGEATLVDTGTGDFVECFLFSLPAPVEPAPDNVIKFLKLKNTSPEPDGTYKDYYLRVPPAIKTVTSGVKWSFGFKPEQRMSYAAQT